MHRSRRQRTRRPPPCRTPTTTTTSRHRRRTKCGAGDRQRSMDWGCWVVDRAQLVRGTLGGRVWPWTGSGLGCAWAGRGVELWPGPGRRGLLGCHGCGLGPFVCPLGGSVAKDARGRGWLAVSGGKEGQKEKRRRGRVIQILLYSSSVLSGNECHCCMLRDKVNAVAHVLSWTKVFVVPLSQTRRDCDFVGVAALHYVLFTKQPDIKFAPMHHIVFNIDIIHTASRPAPVTARILSCSPSPHRPFLDPPAPIITANTR